MKTQGTTEKHSNHGGRQWKTKNGHCDIRAGQQKLTNGLNGHCEISAGQKVLRGLNGYHRAAAEVKRKESLSVVIDTGLSSSDSGRTCSPQGPDPHADGADLTDSGPEVTDSVENPHSSLDSVDLLEIEPQNHPEPSESEETSEPQPEGLSSAGDGGIRNVEDCPERFGCSSWDGAGEGLRVEQTLPAGGPPRTGENSWTRTDWDFELEMEMLAFRLRDVVQLKPQVRALCVCVCVWCIREI